MNTVAAVVDKQDPCWAGADVSKETFDVALARPSQHFPATPLRDLPAAKFERSKEGVKACMAWLDEQLGAKPDSVRLVMEATGRYSEELAKWLAARRPSVAPAIANPAHTAAFLRSLGVRNKTDRMDARALAFYGVERNPAPYTPLPQAWAELREMNRYRDDLVNAQVAQKNQAEEGTSSATVRKMQTRRLRELEKDIKQIETKMRGFVQATPDLKSDVSRLESIYGVGFLTAVVVLTEIGDLRRFLRARQLTAFAGLNPRERKSGTSVDSKPHMSKQGNPRVRQALYMAAIVAIRKSNPLTEMYQRLVAKGKSKMSALGAVMRKLLIVMRAILISGQPFDADFKTAEMSG